MGVDLAESRRLMDAATSGDPEVGLTAVVALRLLLEPRGIDLTGLAARLGGPP